MIRKFTRGFSGFLGFQVVKVLALAAQGILDCPLWRIPDMFWGVHLSSRWVARVDIPSFLGLILDRVWLPAVDGQRCCTTHRDSEAHETLRIV